MSFQMRFVVLPTGKTTSGAAKWVNEQGQEHCVMLVQQAAGAPNTTLWRAGIAVRNALPGQIPPYTAIATFVATDGTIADTAEKTAGARYPTDSLGKHAALYLSHNDREIRVIDQWVGRGEARERAIRFNSHSHSRSNEGNWFHVIEPT